MNNKIKAKIKSLKESKGFTKNVFMITGGTVFAQAITMLLSPIITRLYTPQEYGVLTVYVAVLGLINLLGSLTYDSAIPIATDDEEGFNLVVICLLIISVITSLFILVSMVIGEELLIALNFNQLIKYKYFIPIGFFLTSIYTVLFKWALRKRNFKSITATKYSQSIIGNSTKLGLGLLKIGPTGLILGSIFSQSAGIFTLIKPSKKEFKDLLKQVNYKRMKSLVKRYKRFPLYSAPGLLILSASGQLPTLFIGSLYGAGIVGLYGLARSITFLPMTIIGKSVQDVFYGEAASLGKSNPNRIKELTNKILIKMIILAAIPLSILVLFGPHLFVFVFGANWEVAGMFARILAVEVFFHFIFHPISTIFSIFEQQQKSLIISIIRLVFVLGVFNAAKLLALEPYITVLIYSIAMSLIEILKFVLAQKILSSEIARTNK